MPIGKRIGKPQTRISTCRVCGHQIEVPYRTPAPYEVQSPDICTECASNYFPGYDKGPPRHPVFKRGPDDGPGPRVVIDSQANDDLHQWRWDHGFRNQLGSYPPAQEFRQLWMNVPWSDKFSRF